MQTIPAHQHETLDELLYRTRGDTSAIAAVMNMNPHALHSPRLREGHLIRLPSAPSRPFPPATVKLWD